MYKVMCISKIVAVDIVKNIDIMKYNFLIFCHHKDGPSEHSHRSKCKK